MLQAQSVRELNLWQTRHEFAEKSSKIVPLGAPLFPIKMHVFEEHLETGVCGRSPCNFHATLAAGRVQN